MTIILSAVAALVLLRYLAKAVLMNRRINADIAYLRALEDVK